MKKKMLGCVKAGRLIMLFGWLTIFAGSGLTVATIVPALAKGNASPVQIMLPMILIMIIYLGIGAAQIFLGRAIKQHKEWGRKVGIVYGVINLFGFPIGTIVGSFILYYLGKQWNEISDVT